MRLVERSFGDTMRQAAEIQRSLLRAPAWLEGYDIAVRCSPTDEVGGDFYDFLELEEETLGIAVGDASGHGLPAALLVRDVVVGLRMGMEKDLRPEHALRRLDQVIHTSSLSSCFVSLLLYCNDGDWVESCTALVEHLDGRLEVVQWSGRRIVPLAAAASYGAPDPRALPQPALAG